MLYYCNICNYSDTNKTFPRWRTEASIKNHANVNYIHKQRYAQLLGLPFDKSSGTFDPNFEKRMKKHTEPAKKHQIMKQVMSELEDKSAFEIEERQIRLHDDICATTFHFNCVACELQLDPLVYPYYLKRSAIEHLKSDRHKQAIIDKENGVTKSKYIRQGTSNGRHYTKFDRFTEHDPIKPRYTRPEKAMEVAHFVVKSGMSFNSCSNDNKSILIKEFGQVFSRKVISRGLRLLSADIYKVLQEKIKDHRITMMVDETNQKPGRFVGLIVATLDTEPVQFYKLTLRYIPKDVSCDAIYISDFIFDELERLWPEGPRPDQCVSLISDAVSYMEAAANRLKDATITQDIVQVKCLVHGLHRLSEELCQLCPELHQFLSLFQKVYKRSDQREHLLKKSIALSYDNYCAPPEFIQVRWTTFLTLAGYTKHFFRGIIEYVVSELVVPLKNGKPDECSDIWKLKNLVETKIGLIYKQLNFVYHYIGLNRILRSLERPDTLQAELVHVQSAIDLVSGVVDRFDQNTHDCLKAISVYKKLIWVIKKNSDLPIVVEWAKEDLAYANMPLSSATLENWFSMFRVCHSQCRPMSTTTTCDYVLCKTNIPRYISPDQSQDKRKLPQDFGPSFDSKPKRPIHFVETEPQFDSPTTMAKIRTRQHYSITEAPIEFREILNFPPLPQWSINSQINDKRKRPKQAKCISTKRIKNSQLISSDKSDQLPKSSCKEDSLLPFDDFDLICDKPISFLPPPKQTITTTIEVSGCQANESNAVPSFDQVDQNNVSDQQDNRQLDKFPIASIVKSKEKLSRLNRIPVKQAKPTRVRQLKQEVNKLKSSQNEVKNNTNETSIRTSTRSRQLPIRYRINNAK